MSPYPKGGLYGQREQGAVNNIACAGNTGADREADREQARPHDSLPHDQVAIWENHGQTGTFYSITATRSYQDEQKQWHDSTSFSAGELPTLAKAITDAHSWIAWQERRNKEKSKGGGG